MRKPALRQQNAAVDGGYVLEVDGSVGFRVGDYDPRATLVIDPSLSVGYATFLGGAGEDSAASIALDASGKIYIGGATTSAETFVSTVGTGLGPGGGNSDFFIAKIDPSATGPDSLKYLTFIGGSGTESGGEIAVDGAGNVGLLGVTTSPDYPVSDGSVRTTGSGRRRRERRRRSPRSTRPAQSWSTRRNSAEMEMKRPSRQEESYSILPGIFLWPWIRSRRI